jgi:MFS family permease
MTAPPTPDTQRRTVVTFSLAAFLFFSCTWTIVVYLPIYLENTLGFPRGQIGLLISIFTVTLILLVAPFGHLSDKVSPRKIIQAGLGFYALYSLCLAYAKTLPLMAAAQIVGGIGNSLVIIALPSLYYKHLNTSRKGQKVGLYIFATFFGFALGPLVSGFLLKRFGVSYEEIFLVIAAMMVGLVLFSNVLRDSAPIKISLFEYKKDIFRKEVFLLICMLVSMGIHYGNERASFSLFIKNGIGLDDLAVGTVYAILGLWIAVLAVAAGTLYDRNKKMLLFVCLGMIVSGFFHMLTGFTDSYASVLLVRVLHTTGDSFVIFSMNAIIASIFPTHRMGGNVGFTAFFRMQGAFLGALLSGFLDAHYGYRASFIVAGSCTILIGLLLAANWRTMLKLSKQLST